MVRRTAEAAALRCEDARRIARQVLAEERSEVVDDVLMIVSELVSNAVRHAGGVTGFTVRRDGGAVVVEVADASPEHPRSPGTAPDVPGGFGWMLVNRLGARVDVGSNPGGKTITVFVPV
ncbi:ATP-binding protein [Streptomyces sp. NPDC058701]|uniref:ATP-binding protein n=1 Tax=Streptomyces sp. NPDC058701 TaxID=3346608 RepID=UPI003648F631